jgi:hypothetical protein
VRPFDESELPERRRASLEEAVGEGLMLAEYASRMAIKNAIIVGALTGGVSYDDGTYPRVARETLDGLIAETEASAARIEGEVMRAADSEGRADHVHDYRRADVENLARRQEQDETLAHRLRERRADDDYVNRLVDDARDDAWREVTASIEEELDRVQATETIDSDYERERDSRLLAFVEEDLALLISGVEFDG